MIDMIRHGLFGVISLSLFSAGALAQPQTPSGFVYETPYEYFAGGDFDGDGKLDLVIADKETGKYRLGYPTEGGIYSWVDCRPAEIAPIGGFSVGRLLAPDRDALVFASPDANQIVLVDVSSPAAPARPVDVPFMALGPNATAAVDIGGPGNTPLADLYVTSIYNSPDENLVSLMRNDGAEFPKLLDAPLPGVASRVTRVSLKKGGPEFVSLVVSGADADTLRVDDLSSGKAVTVASAGGLPSGADYTVGNFRGTALAEFIIYKPGESKLFVRPVEEKDGKLALGGGSEFDLGEPIQRVMTLGAGSGPNLLVIFGEGEKAGVFSFDGTQAPVAGKAIHATNELFTVGAPVPDGFLLLGRATDGQYSTRYHLYRVSGNEVEAGPFGNLATLADNDNITIPDIHARIVAKATVREPSAMQLYTNTIPGTRVTYAMVPIPEGEFLMGSPDNEADRNADEGPQFRVKISPFWMGKFEVTWSEYELFMYPDEERRTRATLPTDEDGDKLADAVTHPSKPYVEMSFGMGKEGFPAISMTQHAANKYCQWLSAKTGHFYRLPTEAEWEYAARAGTTTAFFFGDDPDELKNYAWFEDNSDFKYQKVGRKKPNPWGLYDIYGNVVEWVLDQYDPEYYKACSGQGVVTDPWHRATKPYPHSVRGGSWDDPVERCRSAARRGSDRAWKMQDPQLPKSVWYFSDAPFLGFRIVRPLTVPPPEEMQKYWTSGVEKD
jgi:formylglycine-generating enzyme required for sulfatase activity